MAGPLLEIPEKRVDHRLIQTPVSSSELLPRRIEPSARLAPLPALEGATREPTLRFGVLADELVLVRDFQRPAVGPLGAGEIASIHEVIRPIYLDLGQARPTVDPPREDRSLIVGLQGLCGVPELT